MSAAAGAEFAEEAARVRLGANRASSPDLLNALADDVSVTVRAALALNPKTPLRANEMLARDADERVRALLAGRLATLIPGLTAGESRHAQDCAIALLHRLVNDHAERVRGAIAEAVKDMPEAPRALVLRLADDCVPAVSDPVIRLSPVLTDADLLALLASPPAAETAASIARRLDLGPDIADAIIAADDSAAIAALLSNHSAHIREAALDALIARAGEHEDWHDPLVERPSLSARAVRALAGIVTTDLLRKLAARSDLDRAMLRDLGARLQARLAVSATCALRDLGAEEALAEARRLLGLDALNEATLIEALRAGRERFASAILAVAATVPVALVERAAALRSAKALVSLVWSAGFSMAVAGLVQTLIGHIPPVSVIAPAIGGGFPLSQEEMRWQLDFLRRVGR